MDSYCSKTWRNGAWVCTYHDAEVRFYPSIGWHHYSHRTMKEKLGPEFSVDRNGWRTQPAELGQPAA